MKNILSLFFFLSCSTISFAQTNDESLLNSYSKEELTQLKNVEPEKYEILVYALDHGTYVSEYNVEKHGQLKLKELPNIDKIPSLNTQGIIIAGVSQIIEIIGITKQFATLARETDLSITKYNFKCM